MVDCFLVNFRFLNCDPLNRNSSWKFGWYPEVKVCHTGTPGVHWPELTFSWEFLCCPDHDIKISNFSSPWGWISSRELSPVSGQVDQALFSPSLHWWGRVSTFTGGPIFMWGPCTLSPGISHRQHNHWVTRIFQVTFFSFYKQLGEFLKGKGNYH